MRFRHTLLIIAYLLVVYFWEAKCVGVAVIEEVAFFRLHFK